MTGLARPRSSACIIESSEALEAVLADESRGRLFSFCCLSLEMNSLVLSASYSPEVRRVVVTLTATSCEIVDFMVLRGGLELDIGKDA